MSDLKALTKVIHRMVAMDFDVGAVRVLDPALVPLAEALSGLSHTLKQETVASEHIEALFMATPTMLLQLNPAGQITAINPAGMALMGPGVEGMVLAELLAELLADDSASVPGIAELAECARIVILDFAGSERHLDLTLAPLWSRQGLLQGYVVSGVDVTRDVKALQAMDAARRAALTDMEERTRFLASVSHELRTPLNGIIGTLSLMQASGEQSPELAILNRCAEQLMGIVGDVLSFSKLDAGQLSLVAEPLSLADLVRDVAAMLRPRMKAGVALQTDTTQLQVPTVQGDAVRIRQILLNLGSNAARLTAAGHVCLRAGSKQQGSTAVVTLSVEDTGPGIPVDALERIFEPYEQVGRQPGGTGLGLPITRGLVTAMGGTVTAQSAPGAGSTFTATLHLSPATRPAPLPSPPATSPHALRVLLVDDNAINRVVLRKMLERLGCTVEEACDGQDAVARVCQDGGHGLDLVLMDRQMPTMDGTAATRQIRAAGVSELQIIALTASALDEERERCMAAGMNGFLTKPLHFKTLQTLINQHSSQAEPV